MNSVSPATKGCTSRAYQGYDFPKPVWPVVAHLVPPPPAGGGDKVLHKALPWT